MTPRNRFARGSGSYACRCCDRQTRDTGDNGSVRLCPQCYDLAGIENHLSDTDTLDPYMEEAKALIASLMGMGINTDKLFPTIVRAIIEREQV